MIRRTLADHLDLILELLRRGRVHPLDLVGAGRADSDGLIRTGHPEVACPVSQDVPVRNLILLILLGRILPNRRLTNRPVCLAVLLEDLDGQSRSRPINRQGRKQRRRLPE